MNVTFQYHRAEISDHMRARAQRAVAKAAARLPRVDDVVVRFEEDGPTRRVEILLHVPRRRLVAEGTARFFGTALAAAAAHLEAQTRHTKRTRRDRSRRRARARASGAAS